MLRPFLFILSGCFFLSCSQSSQKNKLTVAGLQESVEVFRDSAGVNHIFAKNEHDLFFSQGYCAAKDRLFQFEMWRRQASGTTAEIFGERELKRDIGTRLFKYRGDLKTEFNHYHRHGEAIINAFTEGVNALISETEKDSTLLPLEFKLLGIKPGRWTPDLVISRHQGLLGNITDEVRYGRAVATLGADKVKALSVFEPGDPAIDLDPKIKKELLFDSVITLYEAYRKPFRFRPENLLEVNLQNKKSFEQLARADESNYHELMTAEKQNIGSNNWVVSGKLTSTGLPMLANDPHRGIAVPSLRYMVHLNAPDWNVVGGGEPTIPGVSIGHNEDGAWGLTIFAIDGEDLLVYELNPKNKNQYRYRGDWEDMKVIKDTIKVKGSQDVYVDLKYTRHGPVTLVDEKNNVAYAVRCAWLEPGGAPYMASLRMDQAKSFEEFREACTYSHIPGENMIWADKKGDIGYQAVGIAPIRKKSSGLVPVPGDGSYDWEGFLPIKELPREYNPAKGFWATANQNLVDETYGHTDAIGKEWADPFRGNRINEVLGSGKKFSQQDLMNLQFDYLSTPARTLVPLLKNLSSKNSKVEEARKKLLAWNFVLDKNSIEATIYVAWEKRMSSALTAMATPQDGKKLIPYIHLSKIIQWITTSGAVFKNSSTQRDQFLISSLEETIIALEKKLGPDQNQWQYGQAANHHVLIKHAFSNAVDEATRKKLDAGPVARGGNSTTVGMTTNSDNQQAGASFRMVADVSDWDKTMFTNTPGQSGNPESPYYKNLFDAWAADKHFAVYFRRESVAKAAREHVTLHPH
ncbi:MAG: penicillin acylase family protein [Bacteroidetes bacterium]|nr:penicillin acylase family protein [Bacteroidota bacterium]